MACGCKEARLQRAAAREARILAKQQAQEQAAQQASLTASAQK